MAQTMKKRGPKHPLRCVFSNKVAGKICLYSYSPYYCGKNQKKKFQVKVVQVAFGFATTTV